MRLIRRLRGLLGTAAAWALAWAPVPFIIHAFTGLLSGTSARLIIGAVLGSAFSGAVAGLVFGGVLMLAERHNALGRIPGWRFALWGAAGSLTVPLLGIGAAIIQGRAPLLLPVLVGFLPYLGINALLGAACARGTLALARRAPPSITEGDAPGALPPPTRSRGSLTSA
jgi:hypothetical protein